MTVSAPAGASTATTRRASAASAIGPSPASIRLDLRRPARARRRAGRPCSRPRRRRPRARRRSRRRPRRADRRRSARRPRRWAARAAGPPRRRRGRWRRRSPTARCAPAAIRAGAPPRRTGAPTWPSASTGVTVPWRGAVNHTCPSRTASPAGGATRIASGAASRPESTSSAAPTAASSAASAPRRPRERHAIDVTGLGGPVAGADRGVGASAVMRNAIRNGTTFSSWTSNLHRIAP